MRSGLTAAALVLLYAVAPVGTVHRSLVAWLIFLAGLAGLVILLLSLIRHQHGARATAGIRWEWVALAAYAVIAFFALVYASLAQRPGQFAGLDNRVDALYFTMSTVATVGYGDVHPVGSAARVVVTAQIFFDLTLLAVAARVVGPTLRRGPADRDRPPAGGAVASGPSARAPVDRPSSAQRT